MDTASGFAKAGHYDEATAEYRTTLKGRPGDPRIGLNLALAFYKSGRISEAALELSALRDAQPADLQVVLLLADCWLRQGENRKVIELITPVEKAHPNDAAIAYLLGMALLRDKQIEKGQQAIDRILRNGDSAGARLLLGTAKMNAMDFAGAIADFPESDGAEPANYADIYAFLGLAHRESGDLQAARVAFQKELEQNPNEFESNLNLAVLLKQIS